MNFQKMLEPTQNSRRWNGDMTKVPDCGSTNITRYRTKLLCHSDLAIGIYAPLFITAKSRLSLQASLRLTHLAI
jgi:hypothetical protein